MEFLKEKIRSIPDFPKKGIIFRDITTLLKDQEAFVTLINEMKDKIKSLKFSKIVGIESRGFIFGGVLAFELNKGFVPVRKKGKLPAKTISAEYQLEYGTDFLEIHVDAIEKGEKVVIVDDLLATGGTARAVCSLVEKLGGEVEALIFAIELEELPGRETLKDYNVISIMKFKESE